MPEVGAAEGCCSQGLLRALEGRFDRMGTDPLVLLSPPARDSGMETEGASSDLHSRGGVGSPDTVGALSVNVTAENGCSHKSTSVERR